jgi:hypothetical protein
MTALRQAPYKLVILPPALLPEATSNQVDDGRLVSDDRGSCKGPTRLPPD